MARPHESTDGLEGEDRRIELELKTVADVGLVPRALICWLVVSKSFLFSPLPGGRFPF